MVKNLKNYNKIFLVGIAGVSMSGLALILKNMGKNVFGSDTSQNALTKTLKQNKIKVFSRHNAKNIKGADLVVFSGAIGPSNPEIIEAKKQGVEVIERSELLNLVSQQFNNVIAVSGTHGKTTTTAMIAHIFLVCGLNPTVHLGGIYEQIGGNIFLGGKKFFITEACEFRNSFLTLKPNVSVINNIEPEHMDFFKTTKSENTSFNAFATQTNDICFASQKCIKKMKSNQANIKSYGTNPSCYIQAKNIKNDENGKYSFDCYKQNCFLGKIKLNIYGKHNIQNALAAICVCLQYKIDFNVIYLGLKTFEGVKRRFEYVGLYKNCQIISDYAHHPTEISAAIKTCHEVFNKKIVCIFQPHTYSRTKTLINEFTACFKNVDELYLLSTYPSREKFDFYGSAEYLKQKLLANNLPCKIIGVYKKRTFLRKIKKRRLANQVLLFLGAGDIETLPQKLAKSP